METGGSTLIAAVKEYWFAIAAFAGLGGGVTIRQQRHSVRLTNLEQRQAEDRKATQDMFREIRTDIKKLLARDI